MLREDLPIKEYVLDISNDDRLMLMDMLPNLHTFKNTLRCCCNSSVHLYHALLVSTEDLKDDDAKEMAESLIAEYDRRISEGNVNYALTFTHIGWGDKIIAFKVSSALLGMSGFIRPDEESARPLFVTVSTYDYHDGNDISTISRWIGIKPFTLNTTLKIKETHDFYNDEEEESNSQEEKENG